jgi:hypothetical protein
MNLVDPSYGLGELAGDEVLMVVLVFVSVLLVPAAGDSLTTVVLFSVFESPGGFTVVSFFSQAGRNAAKANRQIYFFIS